MDCFLTGTVPVYHGCAKISEYFNMNGIITFKNEEDIKNIIESLNIKDYNKRIDAIKENFETAKKYRDSVQYSFNKIKQNMIEKDTEIINLHHTDPRTTVDGYKQEHWLNQFFSNGGDDKHLYSFDLDANSIVFDVGAFEGEYFNKIYSKYKCNIHAFEPVTSFVKGYIHPPNSKIIINNFALGKENEEFNMIVDNNSSSQFIKGDNIVKCKKVKFRDYIESKNIKNIDLIKLNIEGAEYELLEEILDCGFHNNINKFLLQFHYLSYDPIKRREKIIDKLKDTHTPIFCYPFVWEYWEKK
jgi:FkbM family methyltransferase